MSRLIRDVEFLTRYIKLLSRRRTLRVPQGGRRLTLRPFDMLTAGRLRTGADIYFGRPARRTWLLAEIKEHSLREKKTNSRAILENVTPVIIWMVNKRLDSNSLIFKGFHLVPKKMSTRLTL
jgi:hypothetical protein